MNRIREALAEHDGELVGGLLPDDRWHLPIFLDIGAKWQIRKSGKKVSLSPSVGNWKYTCQSHYWISLNQVIEAKKFDSRTIEAVQRRDRREMNRYIERTNAAAAQPQMRKPSLVQMLANWLKKILA